MPTFEEVHRYYRQRLDGIEPDSARAFYEIMVARFIILSASLPFALGAVLAYFETGQFNWPVFIVSSVTVFLIVGAVNAGNTYFDYETDLNNWEFSAYSGGIRVLVENKITNRKRALYFAVGLLVAALPLGLSLRFVFHTGPWTIPLGVFGALAGWFYTGKPLMLVYHSMGELVIATCSGALTVISGYYLQAGRFSPALVPLSVALGLSILNVILANEFADRRTDAQSGKRTWLVVLGPERASLLYRVNVVISLAAMATAWAWGVPVYAALIPLAFALPTAVDNFKKMARRGYEGDGINELTLNTFKVHFALELFAAVCLLVGGLVRWLT